MTALKTTLIDAIKHSRRVRFWGAILAAVIVTYVFGIEGSGAIVIILGTFLIAKWRA
ncbi:hypothetical protein [Haladaptatus caseinilyticus]|uniref:hypothetical protein n=1 Tax=Haladaptatus caseinilyticus TaxID=2993314 RepID=UPI00224ADF33|nr:hypothetical protein [Haladaptatus caseinilyticus]